MRVQVRYAGGRAEQWLDPVADTFALRETAERFQYGPWCWPLVLAWAFAVEYLAAIGLDAIWSRTVALAGRLKEGLAQLPGTQCSTLRAPRSDRQHSSALGWRDGRERELSQVLREKWNMVIKPLPHGREGLRASIPFFLLESEIDELLAGTGPLGRAKELGMEVALIRAGGLVNTGGQSILMYRWIVGGRRSCVRRIGRYDAHNRASCV